MIILFCMIVLFGVALLVRDMEQRIRQWVMSELWHAHVAHMKECHPEEWAAKHERHHTG